MPKLSGRVESVTCRHGFQTSHLCWPSPKQNSYPQQYFLITCTRGFPSGASPSPGTSQLALPWGTGAMGTARIWIQVGLIPAQTCLSCPASQGRSPHLVFSLLQGGCSTELL